MNSVDLGLSVVRSGCDATVPGREWVSVHVGDVISHRMRICFAVLTLVP